MISLLAQATSTTGNPAAEAATTPTSIDMWAEAHRLFQTGVSIFSQGDALAQPQTLVEHLTHLGTIWAIVFLITGIACMLKGYQFYKFVVIALMVLIGSLAGYWLGTSIQAPPFITAGCVGLLLAVLAVPLMKYAVAILGGLSGAFIGANLWAGIGRAFDSAYEKKLSDFKEGIGTDPSAGLLAKLAEHMPADAFWIGALAGLLACGILAFVLFKISIHLFTSITGATIAVFGVIALLLNIDNFSTTVAEGLSSSALVIPMLVLVPAAIAFLMQEMSSGALGGKGGQAAAA
ncbi:MAG: hypothetical protein AAGH88_01595 [Planctomycetota bacterium]